MTHPCSLVGQGKKIGGNLCGRDDSCDQHVMQLRQREKCGGREGRWVNSRGRCYRGRCPFCPPAPNRTRPSWSITEPRPTCSDGWLPWQRDVCCLKEQQADRRSLDTLPTHPDFERTLCGSPIAWICTARPSLGFCKLRPMQSGGRRTSFATHDRGAELRVRQSEDQHRPRREVRDH